jgi:hypothetical protein
MPWDHCGQTLADDADCPCGVTKSQWTVNFQVTRPFRVTTGKKQVRITVIDAEDLPVANERFVVTGPDGVEVAGQVDAEGAGRVPCAAAGTYSVRFPDRLAADVTLAPLDDEAVEPSPTAPAADGPARFEVAAGRRLRVRMRGHTFAVKVRGLDHGPAAGVVVTLTLADGTTREATTGPDGVARWVGLPDGPVRYSFTDLEPAEDDHDRKHVHRGDPAAAPDASRVP